MALGYVIGLRFNPKIGVERHGVADSPTTLEPDLGLQLGSDLAQPGFEREPLGVGKTGGDLAKRRPTMRQDRPADRAAALGQPRPRGASVQLIDG